MRIMDINAVFKELFINIFQDGVEEHNARTGEIIHAVPGAYAFKLDLSNGYLPVAGNRKYYPAVAAAETAWQFMGTKDPSFILKHAPKLWSKFVEDGELKTAYGWRWAEAFSRDQLEMALEALQQDPSNRQVYISTWDPRQDGLGQPNQPKNIPCPVGFTLHVLKGSLHMSVHVRSSDVFVGLPYDIMSYALTLDAMAASLSVRPGYLSFTLAHAHIYDRHMKLAKASVRGTEHLGFYEKKDLEDASTNWPKRCGPNLPGLTIRQILEAPEVYLSIVKTLASRKEQNAWDPRPEVVE